MDISQITGFIQLVPLGVCLCVGYIIRNIVPNNDVNKYIPLIMAVVGLAVEIWIAGTVTPDIVLTGMVSGLASSGLYDAFANLIERGDRSSSNE